MDQDQAEFALRYLSELRNLLELGSSLKESTAEAVEERALKTIERIDGYLGK